MDTMQAFLRARANRGKELMVFDWEEAVKRIRDSKCQEAFAGLRDD